MDRLPPATQVDDAEAPHAEASRAFGINTFVIRSPVHDGLTHPVHVGGVHRIRLAANHSSYSAHDRISNWALMAVRRSSSTASASRRQVLAEPRSWQWHADPLHGEGRLHRRSENMET